MTNNNNNSAKETQSRINEYKLKLSEYRNKFLEILEEIEAENSVKLNEFSKYTKDLFNGNKLTSLIDHLFDLLKNTSKKKILERHKKIDINILSAKQKLYNELQEKAIDAFLERLEKLNHEVVFLRNENYRLKDSISKLLKKYLNKEKLGVTNSIGGVSSNYNSNNTNTICVANDNKKLNNSEHITNTADKKSVQDSHIAEASRNSKNNHEKSLNNSYLAFDMNFQNIQKTANKLLANNHNNNIKHIDKPLIDESVILKLDDDFDDNNKDFNDVCLTKSVEKSFYKNELKKYLIFRNTDASRKNNKSINNKSNNNNSTSINVSFYYNANCLKANPYEHTTINNNEHKQTTLDYLINNIETKMRRESQEKNTEKKQTQENSKIAPKDKDTLRPKEKSHRIAKSLNFNEKKNETPTTKIKPEKSKQINTKTIINSAETIDASPLKSNYKSTILRTTKVNNTNTNEVEKQLKTRNSIFPY